MLSSRNVEGKSSSPGGWILIFLMRNGINGFFDPLFQMLERAIEENFMRQQHGDIWKVAQTPEEAVELLQTTPVWDASIRKFAAI